MSRKLNSLVLPVVLTAIVLSSLGAPYRVVQAVCLLGALVLALLIPETIESMRAIRDRGTDRLGMADDQRSDADD
jgi:hypothetical protein